jgi:hypothetical protein
MELTELIEDARSLLSDVTDLSYETDDMVTWANLACSDLSSAGILIATGSTTDTSVVLSDCIAVLNCYVGTVVIYHAEMGEVNMLNPAGGEAPSAWNYDGSTLRFNDNNESTVTYIYRQRLGASTYDLTDNTTIAPALATYSTALAYFIAYRALMADKDDRAGQYYSEYVAEKMLASGMTKMNDQGPNEVKT